MPPVTLLFFKQDDNRVPLVEWLEKLPSKVFDKCLVKLERLETLGHEMRRPEAEYLRDDIYELRVRFQSVNYRMLYFFSGGTAVVVSHGCTKEREVPPREIDLAIRRRQEVLSDFDRHVFKPEE